jgi:hypothetical protein
MARERLNWLWPEFSRLTKMANDIWRIRRARRWTRRRAKLANFLDTLLTRASVPLHMCGEGKRHNWSVLFADLFFTMCPCCLFYRGVAVGALSVALVAALLAAVF